LQKQITMKQTAVEWQFEQFFNSFEKFNNGECTFNDYLKRNLEIREQALEMEKEQKIKFAENCLDKALDLDIRTAFSNVEKYYNETFKQEEDEK
jgi:hypothetical protein